MSLKIVDGIVKFFKSVDLRKVAKAGAGVALAGGATALTIAGVKAANGDDSPVEYQTLGGDGVEEREPEQQPEDKPEEAEK